jgi:hypothetical protein
MEPLRRNESKQSSTSGTSESSVSHSWQGLVVSKIFSTSGRRRTIFLDNPFYRTGNYTNYQETGCWCNCAFPRQLSILEVVRKEIGIGRDGYTKKVQLDSVATNFMAVVYDLKSSAAFEDYALCFFY